MVDKFIGAVFGASGDALRAAVARSAFDCAEAVAGAMAHWDGEGLWPGAPPVPVAIGLHAGEAFCGAVGDDDRLEFTVLGDTVNLAARLEQLAKSLDAIAVVSAQTLDCGRAARTALPPQDIRGQSARVEVWALV